MSTCRISRKATGVAALLLWPASSLTPLPARLRAARSSHGGGDGRRWATFLRSGQSVATREYGYTPAFEELLKGPRAGGTTRPEKSGGENRGQRRPEVTQWLGHVLAAEAPPSYLFVRRCLVCGLLAWLAFPSLHNLVHTESAAVTVLHSAVAAGFAPAVATLYGTISAFTISLLTERIRRIQERVGQEASALAMLTRHTIDLYTTAWVRDARAESHVRPAPLPPPSVQL